MSKLGDSRKTWDVAGAGGLGLTLFAFAADKQWKTFPQFLLLLLFITGSALMLLWVLDRMGMRLPTPNIQTRKDECACRPAMNKWGDPVLLQARQDAFDTLHESGNQRVLKERQLKEATRGRPAVSGAPMLRLTQEDEVRLQVELVVAERAVERAQTMYGVADKALVDDIVEKLAAGQLAATGLKAPLEAGVGDRPILASEWRVLKLDVDRDIASSGTLSYSGIRISKP